MSTWHSKGCLGSAGRESGEGGLSVIHVLAGIGLITCLLAVTGGVFFLIVRGKSGEKNEFKVVQKANSTPDRTG